MLLCFSFSSPGREGEYRIVVTAPHIEDILCTYGLGQNVVGVGPRSRWKDKPLVYSLQLQGEKIFSLHPTHVLMLESQKNRETEKICQAYGYCYYFQDYAWQDVLYAFTTLGNLFHKEKEARAWLSRFSSLPQCGENKTYLYVLWWKPLIIAGSDTFIHSVFHRLGFIHAWEESKGFHPVDVEYLFLHPPDLLFYSQEAGPPPSQWRPFLPPLRPLTSDWINRPGPTLLQGADEICHPAP